MTPEEIAVFRRRVFRKGRAFLRKFIDPEYQDREKYIKNCKFSTDYRVVRVHWPCGDYCTPGRVFARPDGSLDVEFSEPV